MPTSMSKAAAKAAETGISPLSPYLICDGAPYALVVPITFFGLMHTSEDHYLRPAVATTERLVRILAMMMRDYGESDDPAADIRYGVFLRELYFGGQRGIVAREYEAFQRILRRFRMITVYVKLSACDIANISYMTPVYIDVYGCYFAIYSVTTGEDGICECKLIKL